MRPWIIRIGVAITSLLMHTSYLAACPTCTPTDRSFTQRLVHGTSPEGPADLLIAGGMAVAVLITLYLTVRAVLRHDHAH
jgi:hypothetical protein